MGLFSPEIEHLIRLDSEKNSEIIGGTILDCKHCLSLRYWLTNIGVQHFYMTFEVLQSHVVSSVKP